MAGARAAAPSGDESVPSAAAGGSQVSRRDFCACACRAGVVIAAGGLAGCGSPTAPDLPDVASVDVTVSGRTISVTIDAASALAAVGSAALVETALGDFLVARVGASAFTALSAICTHQGCVITGFGEAEFVCPCHGSRFSTSGSVLRGPAQTALESYPTTFDGSVLSFEV